jgi:hypothetical protein
LLTDSLKLLLLLYEYSVWLVMFFDIIDIQ